MFCSECATVNVPFRSAEISMRFTYRYPTPLYVSDCSNSMQPAASRTAHVPASTMGKCVRKSYFSVVFLSSLTSVC